jgi:hypothetical protein
MNNYFTINKAASASTEDFIEVLPDIHGRHATKVASFAQTVQEELLQVQKPFTPEQMTDVEYHLERGAEWIDLLTYRLAEHQPYARGIEIAIDRIGANLVSLAVAAGLDSAGKCKLHGALILAVDNASKAPRTTLAVESGDVHACAEVVMASAKPALVAFSHVVGHPNGNGVMACSACGGWDVLSRGMI